MRRFSALVIAISACNRVAPPITALQASASPSLATASAVHAQPRNTTGLAVEALTSPISLAHVRLSAPTSGEQIALADARQYDVRWVSQQLDPDGLGIDVALDAQRPRRLPGSVSAISLALLVPADEQPAPGEHWLFVAPISASGLIPRPALGAPPAASAVRFLIGNAAPGSVAALGAVWLRKPEGTYNGASSGHVLFDAQAFAADGAPLVASCAIHLAGALDGELDFAGPFSVLALKGGDYAVSASAAGARAAASRFTVNPELGGPK